jgi:hypothetical protein
MYQIYETVSHIFLYFLEMKILNLLNLITRRTNNTCSVNNVGIHVFLFLVITVLYPVGLIRIALLIIY